MVEIAENADKTLIFPFETTAVLFPFLYQEILKESNLETLISTYESQ